MGAKALTHHPESKKALAAVKAFLSGVCRLNTPSTLHIPHNTGGHS